MKEDPPKATPPPQSETPVQQSEPTAKARPVEHLEFKAIVLLMFTVGLIIGSALYLLRARGFFEPTQRLVLIADNAEGVSAGLDLTYSGFPIGVVRSVSLGATGGVRIDVDVRESDAKWLRTTSVFTLVKNLLGVIYLRAYTGVLSDPPLADGAERPVLRGDANEELQRVIGTARDVIDNLNEMTAQQSELNRTLANVQVFTQKLASRQGALHAVFGNEEDARKLVVAVARADAAIARVESLAANADRQVFGADGLATDARATVRQMNAVLTDARGSLQRVDDVLKEAQGIAGNVRTATSDLGSLRGDVEANLRKIEDLINDLNRKWPFAKEREVQVP
jgi:phospholipid/cholesterol/gamma-HCH transport system substrate-binding protein